MSSESTDFLSLLKKSKEILIIIPPAPTDDAICSAFGLSRLISKQQKNAYLHFREPLPSRLSFLKPPDRIIDSLSGSRDFVIIFRTTYNKILKVKTEEKPDEYHIRVTPSNGSIDPRDFSIAPAQFKYDLAIILNTASLESLGKLYQENTDLFFEVPKVNIDHQSSNENYGQVNLVDMTAPSVAEIITQFALENHEQLVDQDIAQSLLAGIIAATDSFQKPNITPNTMILAARLMKYKADQPTIIRHLYKTKSLSFLKLWGRVMARLNWNEKYHCVWSLLSVEDFVQSRSSDKDVPFVLEQVQENFSDGHISAILYSESANRTVAQIRFASETIARQVADIFGQPAYNKTMIVPFESKNLLEAEKEFIDKLSTL